MGLYFLDFFLVSLALFLGKKWLLAIQSPAAGRLPLPPGPKGRPLIGNLLDVPGDRAWLEWTKHKELYGASGWPFPRSENASC